MKTLFRTALTIAAPAFVGLFFSSCVYDPYSYDYGYSSGSVLVSTSSSWWGYDPYRYCYYDYRRNCYYDPYLCGYYRPGYRPPPIAGCPHPRGWRPGHGTCPPPHNPRNHNLAHNLNRLDQVRASNHSWASQVRLNQQSQTAHMRANQAAWRNRVRTQQTTPPTQTGATVQRTRTPNPWFGGGRTITPTPGRTTTPGGQGARGGGSPGHGGNGIQSGNRGHSSRQPNLPVSAGRQPANTQAQATGRAQSQLAAAQSRIQAAQSQQRAKVQAAQQRQKSSSPPARTAPARTAPARSGGGGGRGGRR